MDIENKIKELFEIRKKIKALQDIEKYLCKEIKNVMIKNNVKELLTKDNSLKACLSDKQETSININKLHLFVDINTFVSCVKPSVTHCKNILSKEIFDKVSQNTILENNILKIKGI